MFTVLCLYKNSLKCDSILLYDCCKKMVNGLINNLFVYTMWYLTWIISFKNDKGKLVCFRVYEISCNMCHVFSWLYWKITMEKSINLFEIIMLINVIFFIKHLSFFFNISINQYSFFHYCERLWDLHSECSGWAHNLWKNFNYNLQ